MIAKPKPTSSTNTILGVVILAGFLSGYDYTALNVVVPTLAEQFAASFSITSWVLLAFALVFVAFAIPATNLIGVFGLRRMILAGFSLFAIGSVLCALSTNIFALSAFRGAQALGGSLLFVASPALVRLKIPVQARGRAYGFVALAPAIGMCAGPSIGATLISEFGWQWVFFLNIPVCILGFVLVFFCVHDQPSSQRRSRIDYWGSATSFVGLAALVFAINQGTEQGWTSIWIMSCFVLSFACFSAFACYELRSEHPAINIRLFINPTFGLGALSAFLQMFVVGGLMFILPIYLELGKGLSTTSAGYLLTFQSLALIVVSLTSGLLSERRSSTQICRIGIYALVVTMVLLLQDYRFAGVYLMAVALILLGLSKGLFAPALLKSTLDKVPEIEAQSASGLISTIRVLGQLMGIVVFETILSGTAGTNAASLAEGKINVMDFQPIFWVSLGLSCLPLLPLIFQTRNTQFKHPG